MGPIRRKGAASLCLINKGGPGKPIPGNRMLYSMPSRHREAPSGEEAFLHSCGICGVTVPKALGGVDTQGLGGVVLTLPRSWVGMFPHAGRSAFWWEAMTAPSELQLSFWMDKAVKWGQATTPSAQQDMSKHLGSLRSFLQQLLHTLQLTGEGELRDSVKVQCSPVLPHTVRLHPERALSSTARSLSPLCSRCRHSFASALLVPPVTVAAVPKC
ncbi:hypothetical protein P4O66_022959 [Electrophorus voltai]|uniref:Uncharacterized protein n=1 Tax=Electrophorus voltai TaxID=2609070 RepID=A0AAD8ZLY1_9TELE|nr:hypothetical protein P4O66_022959 [Electrophorus voltai]